eukprot:1648128-Pleurochrysis_carterae.AAC.2
MRELLESACGALADLDGWERQRNEGGLERGERGRISTLVRRAQREGDRNAQLREKQQKIGLYER